MNRNLIRALAGAMATVTVLSAMPASAGERWHHRDHHYNRPVVVQKSTRGTDLLAAGILGLAVGAVAAGIVTQQRTADPEPLYRNPPHFPRPSPDREFMPTPVYQAPHPAVPRSYEPWSREWYRYCAGRYHSFDPGDGTFMGRDGVRRFCVTN